MDQGSIISSDTNSSVDTYSYKGWLTSDNFVKRSMAVVGYSYMGAIFIFLAVVAIGIALGVLSMIGSKIFS